jgi:hypothetical protein
MTADPGWPTARRKRVYKVDAIDPGESWCGLGRFELWPESRAPGDGDYLDQSKRGKIRLVEALTLRPDDLHSALERDVYVLHHVVLERYSLYPWLAREQGYSELLTSQCVGVVKYIARRNGVPYTEQDAKGNLKAGRALAKEMGFRMKDRALGSGRFKYRGPDFDLPGMPHRRDACSHGVAWAARDKSSPLTR